MSLIARKKIIVAGYGLPAEYGITTLLGLGAKPEDVLLVTHPIDSRNAGLRSMAELRKISTIDVDDLSSATVIQTITDFRPDLLLSLHYRRRIPNRILELLPMGGINLHPALLPHYRGTNSVAWAIINGETRTGFTFHRMEEAFDTGAIILQEVIDIGADDTAFSLFHRQISRAMARLEDVIGQAFNMAMGTPQPSGGSYYKRQLPYDGRIDPAWDESKIERFIRAMYFPPFSPAIVEIDGVDQEIWNINEYRRLMMPEMGNE